MNFSVNECLLNQDKYSPTINADNNKSEFNILMLIQ